MGEHLFTKMLQLCGIVVMTLKLEFRYLLRETIGVTIALILNLSPLMVRHEGRPQGVVWGERCSV